MAQRQSNGSIRFRKASKGRLGCSPGGLRIIIILWLSDVQNRSSSKALRAACDVGTFKARFEGAVSCAVTTQSLTELEGGD